MRLYDNTFWISGYGFLRPTTGLLWPSQFFRIWGYYTGTEQNG